MHIPNILIVGGGAGGLIFATRLGRSLGRQNKAKITLLDKSKNHIWKPLLHKLAGGSLNKAMDQLDYQRHGRVNGYHFKQGELQSINRQKRQITLAPLLGAKDSPLMPTSKLDYDYLVLAVGSKANDFGTPGVAEHCLFLDSTSQAEDLRNTLQRQMLKLSRNNNATLAVNIIGAGATGVELAAELIKLSQQYISKHQCSTRLSVNLFEAGDRILPALPKTVSQACADSLTAVGVVVNVGTRVNEVSASGLTTAIGQEFKADLNIWNAGIKGPELLSTLDGLATTRSHRLHVRSDLTTTLDTHIFALGDCCLCPQPDGKEVPARAQAANQMAEYLSKSLPARIKGNTVKPFTFKDKGSLISISQFNAFGIVKPGLFLHGRIARYTYKALYRVHQKALFGIWTTGLITLVDRLNRSIRPAGKLE